MTRDEIFARLGLSDGNPGAFAGRWLPAEGPPLEVVDPSTGDVVGSVAQATPSQYDEVVDAAAETFDRWRSVPAPKRGEHVRRLGDALRDEREALGALVTLETGKVLPEGVGEVQEMIDMADFAVGLSRQLYGATMASERPEHRMYEQWHPLGPVGIITAFNFPVAPWSWNAVIAAVCGDTMVWKPSELTPLTGVAVTNIAARVMEGTGYEGVFNLAVGARPIGEAMTADERLPLISATGSVTMGRQVGPAVAGRFGRTILELGGNNAIVVMGDADLELAVRAVLFAAVGTAGQRCTSLRRLIVDEAVADDLLARLVEAYATVEAGDPMEEGTLLGPVIGERAVTAYLGALEAAREQGGEVLTGGHRIDRPGFYLEPAIVEVSADAAIVQEETFAPILWVIRVGDLAEAIQVHNGVRQGLSSAIFTDSLRAAERFLGPAGSDCGIANVNIGTSGAEIGGAFGGEKHTGGGREAGSDAWKAYMRRQTTTINWGSDLPLAQGITFG